MTWNSDDITRLKSELAEALRCLDVIETSEIKNETHEKIVIQNQHLQQEITGLLLENDRLKKLLELSDVEKRNIVEDNKRILAEKTELSTRLQELEEVSLRQSDKIVALRSVAKALESENELILADKARHHEPTSIHFQRRVSELESELRAKDEERRGFLQCFETIEAEKTRLDIKLSSLEKELETVKKERDNYKTSLVLSNDTLDALRQSKRHVEVKFHDVVDRNERLVEELETLRVEKVSLEEQLVQRTASFEALQHDLEFQVTMYESRLSSMQTELDRRVDEITASKDDDIEAIRTRYVELFEEKARELNSLELDHISCKAQLESANVKLSESEYKEQEMISKSSYLESSFQVSKEIEALTAHCQTLEEKLKEISSQYQRLKEHYVINVHQFRAFTQNFVAQEKVSSLPKDVLQSAVATTPSESLSNGQSVDILNTDKMPQKKKRRNRRSHARHR